MKNFYHLLFFCFCLFAAVACAHEPETNTLLEETRTQLEGKWYPERATAPLYNQNGQLLQAGRAPSLQGTLDISDNLISTLQGFPLQDPFIGTFTLTENQGAVIITSGLCEIKVLSVTQSHLTLRAEEQVDGNRKVTTVEFSKVTQIP
ncbi:hypothetical protein [Rufibacter ruber]|uniref:hypothetical protein n=1 Tax=Rufibacter ruber TaxID=1783499 RepID=UPI0008304895|nr:hypothetical protein [Rufibacter ruber]